MIAGTGFVIARTGFAGSAATLGATLVGIAMIGAVGGDGISTAPGAAPGSAIAGNPASSLRRSTLTSEIGVFMRAGACPPPRSAARSCSGGLTRRILIAVWSALAPNCAAAAGESAISFAPVIGPRSVTRTRIVRPVSSEVTSA